MFRSLKNLISSLVEDARLQKFEDTDCRLAAAALLTRVATVDSEMSEARRGKLHAVLKSCFGLDDLTTAQLIHEAAAAERSAVDLYHFTRQINEVLDNEGRQRIVKMMWQVIYGDERVNEFESNIIWRTADLLGVSSRQRIRPRCSLPLTSELLRALSNRQCFRRRGFHSARSGFQFCQQACPIIIDVSCHLRFRSAPRRPDDLYQSLIRHQTFCDDAHSVTMRAKPKKQFNNF